MERRIFNFQDQKELRQFLRNNATPSEGLLWFYLKQRKFHGLKFRRQHGIGQYVVDFYCPSKKLVIEVDGDTHLMPGAAQRDVQRQRYIESLGLKVVRFRSDEVRLATDQVLERLGRIVDTTPLPLLREEGN